MTPNIRPSFDSNPCLDEKSQQRHWQRLASLAAIVGTLVVGNFFLSKPKPPTDPVWGIPPAPLVMQGGDPYLRALMRTISVAESNTERPYSVLYGGEHIEDLSQHPDRCITIVSGPNQGNCSTAAGRYQFITTTWQEKAAEYHPKPSGFWFWRDFRDYSFAPEYQDQVVYHWLSDPQAWGTDLSELLRQERLAEVLEILSPTWTSLGYGIEPNSMTDLLPQVYQQLLQEELATKSS